MGDADESYDFSETDRFVKSFRKALNWSRVAACRAEAEKFSPARCRSHTAGSGTRSFREMARHMFAAPIHDVYCGLRGFTRELYDRLELQCDGMEFATEMIIKASLHGAHITEIPITLHPDGRKTHAPHLRTVRDGWRTLRFFLVFSPRWLFLVPGFVFRPARTGRICCGIAGIDTRRRDLRRSHPLVFQPGHYDGLSIGSVRYLRQDLSPSAKVCCRRTHALTGFSK